MPCLHLPYHLSTYRPFKEPVTARKASTVEDIAYAQKEDIEAKIVNKQRHEKTMKRRESNNNLLITLLQHDNQLININ